MCKTDIRSLDERELEDFFVSHGEPKYRAKQTFSELSRGRRINEITALPASLRGRLCEICEDRLPVVEKKLVSSVDGTVKYLFGLIDGECVESVFMRYEHGNTVCISSQVGCRMGCKFCASTIGGKIRDLTPSEMLGQIIAVQADTGERVSNIVMMGIGEPLDNYDNTVKFLRLVSSPSGMNIGLRHISVSTCGLVPGIGRLSDEGLPITLSVSLHAYDDEVRSSIMPVNKKYGIDELLSACRKYFDKTGRRVSFEYTLIGGKNDTVAGARALASKIRRDMDRTCHVNLIALNEVKETGLVPPTRENTEAFRAELEKCGINATVRRKLGPDINASCGQLRRGEKQH